MAKLDYQLESNVELGNRFSIETFSKGPSGSIQYFVTHPGFNMQMAYAGIAILIFSIVGCVDTQIHVPNVGGMILALALVVAVVSPVVLYLHEKRKRYWVDLIVTVFWAIFFTYILNFPVVIAARIGLGFQLQDTHLVQLDKLIGCNLPAIADWASGHVLGKLASSSYFLLFPFMRTAVLLPAAAGRAKYAKQFLTANLIAFAVGLPFFALLPAVGPWYGYHLAARPDQLDSQATLFHFRLPGPCEYHLPTGIICFPSFHVIWAILSARALWFFRPLRIPISLFSGLIIFSTVTTREHYIFDVLAGALLAVIAAVGAKWLGELSLSPQTAPEKVAIG